MNNMSHEHHFSLLGNNTVVCMVVIVMCEINLHHLYNLLITASLYGLSKKIQIR